MYISKVEQMLKKPLNERAASPIHYVTIDGNRFEDYGEFSFFWEKTYQKEPSRSTAGVISNLDTMPTFLVPHLKITYSLMSIEDYRRLANLMMSRNEFTVTCYDAIAQQNTTNQMYFLPDQMPSFLSIAHEAESGNWTEIVGVKEYTIEMVGTLSEYEGKEITIKYNLPDGYNFDGYHLQPIYIKSQYGSPIKIGEEIIIGDRYGIPQTLVNGFEMYDEFDNPYRFVGWKIKSSNSRFIHQEEYTFFADTDLYMIVERV